MLLHLFAEYSVKKYNFKINQNETKLLILEFFFLEKNWSFEQTKIKNYISFQTSVFLYKEKLIMNWASVNFI